MALYIYAKHLQILHLIGNMQAGISFPSSCSSLMLDSKKNTRGMQWAMEAIYKQTTRSNFISKCKQVNSKSHYLSEF